MNSRNSSTQIQALRIKGGPWTSLNADRKVTTGEKKRRRYRKKTSDAANFREADFPMLGSLFKKKAPQIDEAPVRADSSHLKSVFSGVQLALSDFHLFYTVGTGAFGRVRMVKYLRDPESTPLALKIVKKSEVVRLKQVDHIRNEKAILESVDHPFIVNLLATFQDEHRLYFVFEFVNGGELFTHLRKAGKFSTEEARFYAAEVVLAFEYLHARQIAYRDTKPENVLIDSTGHIKLSDFGFAKVVSDRTWTSCGTPEYLSPEIVQAKGHNSGVDWWALGILIFEMLCGYPPYFADTAFEIYQKILDGHVDFPRFFDSKAKDLVKGLLAQDRAKRLGCLKAGAEDIKKHRFFSKYVDWTAAANRQLIPVYVPPVRAPDDTSMFDSYPESQGDTGTPGNVDYSQLFKDF